MRHLIKSLVGLSLIAVLFMGACSAPASPGTPAQSQPTAYSDPFAYCAAVETVTHWGQAPERQRQATGGPILGRVG